MPANHARNVALTPQLDRFVDELIDGGTYGSASEVIRDGLRELKRRIIADQLGEIQMRIGTALDQLDRGEGVEGSARDVLSARLQAAKDRAAS